MPPKNLNANYKLIRHQIKAVFFYLQREVEVSKAKNDVTTIIEETVASTFHRQ